MEANKSFFRAVKSVIRTKRLALKKPKLPLQSRPSRAFCRRVFRCELAPATTQLQQPITTTTHLCPICSRCSQRSRTIRIVSLSIRTIRKLEKVHLSCICRLLSSPRVKRKRLGRSPFMTMYQLLLYFNLCSKLEPTNMPR